MDNKNVEIFTSVVYKEFMVKSLDGNVNFEEIKKHVQSLLNVANELSSKTAVPFVSAPAGSPRGTKVVGMACGVCGSPLVASKKVGGDPWCIICWKKKKGV